MFRNINDNGHLWVGIVKESTTLVKEVYDTDRKETEVNTALKVCRVLFLQFASQMVGPSPCQSLPYSLIILKEKLGNFTSDG